MIFWLLVFQFLSSLISVSCIIALARISSTILERYRESEQPCHVSDFSGIDLSFFLFILMLAGYILSLLCLGMRLVFPISPKPLMWICWILLYALSASEEMVMWGLLFQFVYVVDTLMDFYMVNHCCIPWMMPTWS